MGRFAKLFLVGISSPVRLSISLRHSIVYSCLQSLAPLKTVWYYFLSYLRQILILAVLRTRYTIPQMIVFSPPEDQRYISPWCKCDINRPTHEFQHPSRGLGHPWGDIDGRPTSVIPAGYNRKSGIQILDGLSERLMVQKNICYHNHLTCYVSDSVWSCLQVSTTTIQHSLQTILEDYKVWRTTILHLPWVSTRIMDRLNSYPAPSFTVHQSDRVVRFISQWLYMCFM